MINVSRGGVFVATTTKDAVGEMTAIISYVAPEPIHMRREEIVEQMKRIFGLIEERHSDRNTDTI